MLTPRFFALSPWMLPVLSTVLVMCMAPSAFAQRESRPAGHSDARVLLNVQSGYAIWQESELHPETAEHVAPSFTHRFYLQPLDEEQSFLTYELEDVADSFPTAIRKDITILLENRRAIHIVPKEDKPHIQHLGSGALLRAFPDGVVLSDWSVRPEQQRLPVYFVPLEGSRLDFDNRLEVVSKGVGRFERWSFPGAYPGSIARHDDTLAWIVDGKLHTLGLKDQERTATPLEHNRRLKGVPRVRAYDGETIFIFAPYDTHSGRCLWDADNDSRVKRYLQLPDIFAVRNRFGYFFKLKDLYVVDLTSMTSDPVLLKKTALPTPYTSDDGIPTWDGTRWEIVPWLTRAEDTNAKE